ncbi:LPXTG cell wall anchor domain-containing protein [Nocardioides sp. URHA0020]|nr:LPXTG cell wall anchor domain-containing protein [Nocardioides sp. URHA0020]
MTAIRRPPGGGHFLVGLSHAQTWVLVIGIVLIVLAIYWTRRR